MAGFLRGWLEERAARRLLRLRQRLRRAGRLAPRLRAGDAELDRAAATSSPTARRERALRLDADARAPAPRDHPAADWPELAVFAFDHRVQLEELAARTRRRRRRAHRPLQGPARRRRAPRREARAAPAARGFGVDPRRPLRRGHAADADRQRRLDRPAGRAARGRGRSPSRAAPTWRWRCAPGRPSTSPSAWSATTRRRSGRAARGAARAAAGVAARLHRHRPRAAGGSDPAARGRARAPTPWRARWSQIYAAGVRPDWWKLPPPESDARVGADRRRDRAPRSALPRRPPARPRGERGRRWRASFAIAAPHARCKGFAVGRSIFGEAAAAWFARSDERRGGRRRRRRALRPAGRRSGAGRAAAPRGAAALPFPLAAKDTA